VTAPLTSTDLNLLPSLNRAFGTTATARGKSRSRSTTSTSASGGATTTSSSRSSSSESESELGFIEYGHVGYAKQGSCESCSVSMSEAFPSASGADCAFACPLQGYSSHGGSKWVLSSLSHSSSHLPLPLPLSLPLVGQAGGYNGYGGDGSVDEFMYNMELAGDIILSYGEAVVTAPENLHISFNYFCCYGHADYAVIKRVFLEHS
jgi:hypothetical protein